MEEEKLQQAAETEPAAEAPAVATDAEAADAEAPAVATETEAAAEAEAPAATKGAVETEVVPLPAPPDVSETAAAPAPISADVTSPPPPDDTPPPAPPPPPDAPEGETFGDLFADGNPEALGASIPKTEERAITIKQLERVLKHIGRRAPEEGWRNYKGDVLAADQVSLYETNTHVIKPSTKPKQTSFVEMIATFAQVPKWFCSHWWGEPVADFIKCLMQHCYDRYGDRGSFGEVMGEVPYWVCAYANNQWKLAEELADELSQTSFRKALDLSEGCISVLDKNSIVFSRVWCCYEIYVALTVSDGRLKYDVYTAHDHEGYNFGQKEAVGFIDGGSFEERKKPELQTLREGKFPWEVRYKGMKTKLQSAEASFEGDRVKILNSIAGTAAGSVPPTTCEAYDALNNMLRGRFAVASLKPLMDGKENQLIEAVEAMRVSSLRSITLNFTDASKRDQLGNLAHEPAKGFTRHAAKAVFENLPIDTHTLILPRSSILEHLNEFIEFGLLALTTSLTKLDLSHNRMNATAHGALCSALINITTLADLNVSGTFELANFAGTSWYWSYPKLLESSKSLKSLNLGKNAISTTQEFFAGGLRTWCSEAHKHYNGERLDRLLQTLAQPKCCLLELNLAGASIGWRGSYAIKDAFLANALPSIQSLDLSDNGLFPIGAIQLFMGIKQSRSLKKLKLVFNSIGEAEMDEDGKPYLETDGKKAMDTIKEALVANTTLEQLILGDNQLGNGLSTLSEAIAQNTSLKMISLATDHYGGDFVEQASKKTMDALASALQTNKTLELFSILVSRPNKRLDELVAWRESVVEGRPDLLLFGPRLPSSTVEVLDLQRKWSAWEAAHAIPKPAPLPPKKPADPLSPLAKRMQEKKKAVEKQQEAQKNTPAPKAKPAAAPRPQESKPSSACQLL